MDGQQRKSYPATLAEGDVSMQINYELTQADFIDAFTAHRNRHIFRKWIPRFFMSILIVVAALLAFGLLVKRDAQDEKNLLPLFVLIFGWIWMVRIFPRWNARKQFLRQPGALGPRSVSMDATGVHWRWNGGSSDILWKNYVRTLEGRAQFLLCTSPVCFNIIPKRALTQEGLLEVRGLLKQNIS